MKSTIDHFCRIFNISKEEADAFALKFFSADNFEAAMKVIDDFIEEHQHQVNLIELLYYLDQVEGEDNNGT